VAAKLPIDVRELYAAGKRLKEDRERPVRIAVLVEIDAPDALVEAAKVVLHPKTANGIVDVSIVEPGVVLRVDSRTDACIVLVGSGSHLAATLHDLRERALPVAVVALRDDRAALARSLGHPEADVLVGTEPEEALDGPLADWAMARMEKLRFALGHNFEFMRRAAAKEIVKQAAWQNAAIGVVLFIPGADMPLMTLNQGRMLLQIAAAYGQPLDTERIKELGAVVAGGFLFRTFARELIGLVPGFGWALKGGIAYSGTMAMGSAAIAYFEEGADLSGVVRALGERVGETAVRVANKVRHSDIRTPVIELDEAPAPAPESAVAGSQPADGQPRLLDVPVAPPTLAPPADSVPGEARL